MKPRAETETSINTQFNLRGWRGSSIGTRMFLLAAGAILVTVSFATLVSTVMVSRIAEQAVTESLADAPQIAQSFMAGERSRVRSIARSLSEEPGLKALVAPGVSAPTRYAWARDTAELLHASSIILLDRTGRLVARNGPNSMQLGLDMSGAPFIQRALAQSQASGVSILDGAALAIAGAAPILIGTGSQQRVGGVVMVGEAIDNRKLERLAGICQCDVAVGSVSEGKHTPLASVGVSLDEVGALLAGPEGEKLSHRTEEKVVSVDIGGKRRWWVGSAIKTESGTVIGGWLMGRWHDRETAAFRTARLSLIGVGLLSLLLLIPIAYRVGRKLAEPAVALAAAAQEIQFGNLDIEIPIADTREFAQMSLALRDMLEDLRERRALKDVVQNVQRRTTAKGLSPSELVEASAEPSRYYAGRYDVLEEIGRGGMGVVYRAIDVTLDQEVALKRLRRDAPGRTEDLLELIKQETKTARMVTHPNVVRTHDMGEANGELFITMELVNGTPLKVLISERGSMKLQVGIQVAKQLCRGLQAIHDAGVIHRDIKASNVMLLPQGLVKLMDFGLSRSMAQLASDSDEYIMGTPAYMSPEQLRGDALTPKSDLYALGILLWEIFVGDRPFKGDVRQLKHQHLEIEPDFGPLKSMGVPRRLVRLVRDCLSKDPKGRPASARAVFSELVRAGSSRIDALGDFEV